jgi:hypothetical protein
MYFTLQKKSREESSGSGSGVEIKLNEPYTDGPGGSGQYTYKIYHIGSHLPGRQTFIITLIDHTGLSLVMRFFKYVYHICGIFP